ncbi:MAG: hypothetical protein Q9182_005858 [Xanthomendoza sp. 2 TL-2023]
MLFPSFSALFALFLATVATGQYYGISTTCRVHTSTTYLIATFSVTPHGSLGQGSVLPSATRCPRVKPTVTTTSFIQLPATVVPTSSGFTPISVSNTASTFDPLPSDFISLSLDPVEQVFTTTGNNRPQQLDCYPELTTSSPPIITPSTCPGLSTVTTSTTITTPSDVQYDACNKENVATIGRLPGPIKDPDLGRLRTLKLYNITSYARISTLSQQGCCQACQQLGCAYGQFIGNVTTYPTQRVCEIYFQDECNGKEWLGSVYSTGPANATDARAAYGFQVFNGPCGRILDGGPES